MSEEVTMDSMDSQQGELEAHRAQANRVELVERIARAIREDGTVEPLKGVRLYRSSLPTESIPGVSAPAFAVIAQGSKELYLGEERHRYDPYHYCLGTVELPVVSQIIEASKERPPYDGLVHQYRLGQIEAMVAWLDTGEQTLLGQNRQESSSEYGR